MFARNIIEQGFAEAARKAQHEAQASTQPPNEQNSALDESQHNRTLRPFHLKFQNYLEIKDNYPDALVLIKAGEFYETYSEDALVIADQLELVRTGIDSGDPDVGRVPLAGFLVRALNQYLQQLIQEFDVVTVEEQDLFTVHSQQQPQLQQAEHQEQITLVEAASSQEVLATQAEAALTEVEELSLFDLNSFTATSGYEFDTTGYDPSWDSLEKPLKANPGTVPIQPPEIANSASETASQSSQPTQQFNLKEIADRVRELDLVYVAASLGLKQDRHDKHKWKDGEHIISISGGKFMDWTADTGGGGAIDLVMHVQGVEFREAVQWLSGQSLTAQSVTYQQPTQSEDNSFHGLAAGSSREQGWFWIGAGKGEVKRVMLTESPIDALSLATLDKRRQATAGVFIYLSTDGSGAIPTVALKQVLERGGQVGVASDTDSAGETMAWRIAQELPGVGRITPAYGKDWNERLICDGQPEQASQPERDKQTLDALWRWHRIAQQLGKSPNYLSRITEVAREVAKGASLSKRARVAMEQDWREGMKQQGQAKTSLQSLAIPKRPRRDMGIDR